ncbi:hypothetical protein Cgig2_009727 [Carnegiea gigantea]|uniref:Uncharacterized protein n=1 Tax=Carnegiea gigantea TaxID=171969 RepID=A0A9Q1QC23_9CARY|nr:hypothetical protein Cgig2_009727 [Carnegiea gigantea]
MSYVNVMADHNVSIENLRYDVGHYEYINLNILDVSETREEEENDEEKKEEVEEEDEEFEDFISDEDEELAIGDICLDDSENEDDNPNSDDEPTPSNTTPSTSTSPNPTPSTALIPNRTSSLPNSHASPYSSPRIQTPVFNSDESPQPDVHACRSISSGIQLENPPSLDSSTEVNITRKGKTQIWPYEKGQWVDDKSKPAYVRDVQKLSGTQATQSTHATVDVSTPLTPSGPSYDEQMKI